MKKGEREGGEGGRKGREGGHKGGKQGWGRGEGGILLGYVCLGLSTVSRQRTDTHELYCPDSQLSENAKSHTKLIVMIRWHLGTNV